MHITCTTFCIMDESIWYWEAEQKRAGFIKKDHFPLINFSIFDLFFFVSVEYRQNLAVQTYLPILELNIFTLIVISSILFL